ncbi:DNA-binding protein D-ETS-6 isoform X2 [Drosophila nasuta]|uniref:DNA-binding protein D-ETS-6 isoform X2 n=1 Tax=Drosophila nasuta TaxID=42062 RepID=UPI00295E68A4|nr:DNA-binding protein D-ETS-6 isoform X2 [Drosophila nasuta]
MAILLSVNQSTTQFDSFLCGARTVLSLDAMHQDVRSSKVSASAQATEATTSTTEAALDAAKAKTTSPLASRPRRRQRQRRRSSSSSDSDSSSSTSDSSTSSNSESDTSSSSSSKSSLSSRLPLLVKSQGLELPDVSPPSNKSNEEQDQEEEEENNGPGTPVLPVDPHVWTTEDIASWVKWLTRKVKIDPEPDITRFPKDGNELCQLSRADFWVCAGSRRGGILLAKHFALSLYRATGRETSPMLNENEPSTTTTRTL